MTVVDVEYQFDRHKITIYYDSPLRIDFRELVRDLFSSFKVCFCPFIPTLII